MSMLNLKDELQYRKTLVFGSGARMTGRSSICGLKIECGNFCLQV